MAYSDERGHLVILFVHSGCGSGLYLDLGHSNSVFYWDRHQGWFGGIDVSSKHLFLRTPEIDEGLYFGDSFPDWLCLVGWRGWIFWELEVEIPATQSMTHRDASISIGRKELLFRGLTSEWGPSLFLPKNLSSARVSLSSEEGTGKPTTNAPVYLTFDDGPGPNTYRLAELLHERGMKASFFVLGRHIKGNEEIISKLVRDGHTIGTHGYSHLDAWTSLPSDSRSDLAAGIASLENLLPSPLKWSRPPYGHVTPWMLKFARDQGLFTVLWNVNPADYYKKSQLQNVLDYVTVKLRSNSVVLLHEQGRAWRNFEDSMPRFLDELVSLPFHFHAM